MEQYICYHKAKLFDTQEVADSIYAMDDPKDQKFRAKKLANFNATSWDDQYLYYIILYYIILYYIILYYIILYYIILYYIILYYIILYYIILYYIILYYIILYYIILLKVRDELIN